MANKKETLKRLENARSFVLDNAKSAHSILLNTTEELIDGSISTAENIQNITSKTLQKTEPLIEKQVDILFDIAEEVFVQIDKSSTRFQELLGITDQVAKAKEYANQSYKNASKAFSVNLNNLSENVKDATEQLEKKYEQVSKVVKENAAVVIDKVEDRIENIASTVKASSDDAIEVVEKSQKMVSISSIKGIGPKMEKTLAKIGVQDITDLAKVDAKELSSKLAKENSRYATFDPTPWINDAKKAIEKFK